MADPYTDDFERDPARIRKAKAIATARWDPGYQPAGSGKLPGLLVGLDGSVLARFTTRDRLADQWHVLHAGPMLLGASGFRCGPGVVVAGEMVFTAPGVPSWQSPSGWVAGDFRAEPS
jgi:hypothetical protein